MENKDKFFYLEKLFPDANAILSNSFRSIEEIKDSCIFVLDTNILLMPFNTSKNSLKAFKDIYSQLKSKNSLRIPERVIREYGKNRGKNLASLYKYLVQKENNLNKLQFRLEIQPIFEDQAEFKQLKKLQDKYNSTVNEIRSKLTKLQDKVYENNWDDPVSKLYQEIISPEIIVSLKKDKDKLIEDLQFRTYHSIAPGFKDSNKSDKGIGDLIIWQTIIEIAETEKCDIIFVTNDSKNDWFYVEENRTVHPRYELLYEFKYKTKQSIHIVDVTKFLNLFGTDEETVKEVEAHKDEVRRLSKWELISPDKLRVGMEVKHTNAKKKGFERRRSGVIMQIQPYDGNQYIVSLRVSGFDKLYHVMTGNYLWWRKVSE